MFSYRVAQATFPLLVFKIVQPMFRLQRCVIRRWNGNFVTFHRIISKIVKNFPMMSNLQIPG